ncbi:unnamed protein product [Arabis nemorensis]|uniref:F-box domain-containing protein n=1 Tax=Arabis nemorensis TaxID=586526 RepID=A0A565B0A5_9BRAS|nr:unnamed protein product [Arabis nemorensis]
MDLPEEIVINIIARVPLQSIIRFKLVCREWKSLIESEFFRDLFHSNSNSTSSNWSILHGTYGLIHSCLEELKLDLPRESSHGNSHNLSFASSFTQNNNNKIKEITVVACADGLVLLRLKPDEEDMMIRYYIGNPVLPQWIQLPPRVNLPDHKDFNDSGLVTRMHNGVLLGYKVVRIYNDSLKLGFSRAWTFEIFSSDTGEWSVQQVSCPDVLMRRASNPVSLNGKLHWLDCSRRLILHDFFSHDDQVRAICLPSRMKDTQWEQTEFRCSTSICPSPCGKKICTTSQGYFVLIDVGLIGEVKSSNVRVWRLKTDSWNWEKAWEINMACIGLSHKCVPMGINCFDVDIIYLWDLDRKCFLACNLRTDTKSYGTRKHGTFVYKGPNPMIRKPFGNNEDRVEYKEDSLCFDPRSCLSQFVPTLHVVPTKKLQRNPI